MKKTSPISSLMWIGFFIILSFSMPGTAKYYFGTIDESDP